MFSDLARFLAKSDLEGLLPVIAILGFAVLSWLGNLAKGRQKRQDEAEATGPIQDLGQPKAPEAGGPPRPPPVAKPMQRDKPAFPRHGVRPPAVRRPDPQRRAPRRALMEAPDVEPPKASPVRTPLAPEPVFPDIAFEPQAAVTLHARRRAVRPRPAAAPEPRPARKESIPPIATAGDIAALSPKGLRKAIVMAEILAPPLALRERLGPEASQT